jgi:hypothetical protein
MVMQKQGVEDVFWSSLTVFLFKEMVLSLKRMHCRLKIIKETMDFKEAQVATFM